MSAIWTISDLHLSFGVKNKEMDAFGPQWKNHADKIAAAWKERINKEDLILLCGDFSWAMTEKEVQADLDWLDALPGTKIMIKGNHDYWWPSQKKMQSLLPASIISIYNNAWSNGKVTIGGTRLWDNRAIQEKQTALQDGVVCSEQDDKIFQRENERLARSLQQLDEKAPCRIAMTHYPPIGPAFSPTITSDLLEHYRIDIALFGHLHGLSPTQSLFGEHQGIRYVLTSCDYLNFIPLRVGEF